MYATAVYRMGFGCVDVVGFGVKCVGFHRESYDSKSLCDVVEKRKPKSVHFPNALLLNAPPPQIPPPHRDLTWGRLNRGANQGRRIFFLMCLYLLFDAPITLADLHYLTPKDFEIS